MKWFHRLFAAVAVALGAVACTLDPFAETGGDGAPVAVSFDVGLVDALTKADNTPLDNGSGDFQLYVAVFDKEAGALLEESQIGGEGYQPVAGLSGGAASVKMQLAKNRDFHVVFFAMKEGAYTPFFANNNSARFGVSKTNLANDASKDAFYANVDVTAGKTTYDIKLKRPFAQLNVLVPDGNVPEGQTAFKSTMTVKMPIFFDLYGGKASGTEAEVTFTANAISAGAFGTYAGTHKWIGMNYVLVPESGQVEVTSFQEDGMDAAIAPGKVPVKVNGRTNLVGNLYGTVLDFSVTVVVNPDFASPDKILVHETFGCYLPGHERSYVAGADQYVREYDGTALDFVLLNVGGKEQIVIRGYQTTMKAGDPVEITVDWKKDKAQVLLQDYEMTVVKEENRKVWIADQEGNGFVIKK